MSVLQKFCKDRIQREGYKYLSQVWPSCKQWSRAKEKELEKTGSNQNVSMVLLWSVKLLIGRCNIHKTAIHKKKHVLKTLVCLVIRACGWYWFNTTLISIYYAFLCMLVMASGKNVQKPVCDDVNSSNEVRVLCLFLQDSAQETQRV